MKPRKPAIRQHTRSKSARKKQHQYAENDGTADADFQPESDETDLTSVVLTPWGSDDDDAPVSFDTSGANGVGLIPLDMSPDDD